MMQTVVQRHVNLVDEALNILYHIENTDNLHKKLEDIAKHYTSGQEGYEKKLSIVMDIFNDVKERLSCPKEKLAYYFKERTTFMMTYGRLALVYETGRYDCTIDKLKQQMRLITVEERVRIYADIIWSEGAENISDEALTTVDDFISFLEKSPLKSEECWEVLKIFNSQEKHFKEVMTILEEVIGLLNENKDKIKQLEEAFSKTWQMYLQGDRLLVFIKEKSNTDWEDSEKGTVIMPVIFLLSALVISLKSRLQDEDVVRIGILFDDSFSFGEKNISSDQIVKFGKVISDKSKVELLKFISEKPAYGKEIADALKLSTATISYHVNALMQLGLLKTAVKANRVYYCLNHEAMQSQLLSIRQYLSLEK